MSAKSKIERDVYNGKCKLIVGCRNFMLKKDVEICMSELGSKKSQGFDRIPVCAVFHSRAEIVETTLSFLNFRTVP